MAGYIELFRNFCALSAIAVVAPTILKGGGGGYTNEMVSMLGEAQLTVTSDCPGDQDCNDIYVTIDCHGIRQTTGGVYIGTG